MVASAESVSIGDMAKGYDGRLEASFKAAKEKGEAAFVTFVTAGYPSAQGEPPPAEMFSLYLLER